MNTSALSIEEGNKMIAEFDGWKYVCSKVRKEFNQGILTRAIWVKGIDILYQEEKFKYHSSWDWLMPVVEKIEGLGYNTDIISYVGCNNVLIHEGTPQGDGGKFPNYIVDISAPSKIENVWQAVVQFIQWYKQNQQ